VLDWLCARFSYHSRATWARQIDAGRVLLDGRPTTPEAVLAAGQELAYHKQHVEPDAPIDVAIVHESAGFVVVDKPAGLPMHADGAFLTRTVVGVLQQRLGGRMRAVHRLDRETSGLCVVARTRSASRALREQFDARTVDKQYLAIVHGTVADDRLVLDAPLGRDPQSAIAIRRAVVAADAPDAEPARTDVAVRERFADATLVALRIATGRRHQIRVHLAAAGHPLCGDKLYGQSDDAFLAWVRAVKAGRADPGRQLLHAAMLAFDDPESGARRAFASELPADMRAFLAVRRGFRVDSGAAPP
jgi:23S rRNA pseudouridine1911/1915/1917 synthase